MSHGGHYGSVGDEAMIWMDAARATLAFIGDGRVSDRWSAESSLPLMTVSELTGHLVHSGILMVGEAFAIAEVSDSEPVTAAMMLSWVPADPDSSIHADVRHVGGSHAAHGLQSLIERATVSLDAMAPTVATVSQSKVVAFPWAPKLSMTAGELFLSRIVELVVHVDDLARSVGEPTIPLDDRAIATACHVAADINIVRHGPTAVVRSLCRPDRSSPDTLRTF